MSTSCRRSPCHRCLWEPLLIGGVEKPFAIVNATLAIALVGDLHFYGWLLVAALFHGVMRHLTASDPFLRQIYARYNWQADQYVPWPPVSGLRGRRPVGWGRGLAC